MRRLVGLVCAFGCLTVGGGTAVAAVGDFDPAFGSNGGALAQIGQGPAPSSQGYAIALAADGKLVTVGHATDGAGQKAAAIVRYTSTGAPDMSFGPSGNGVVVAQFGLGTPSARESVVFLNAVAVLPDGRVVISGYATDASGDRRVLVARYTAAGALDPSFASGGVYFQQLGLATPPFRPSSQASGLAAMGDGRIVVAGTANDAAAADEAFALRLTAAGTPDPAFGSGGTRRRQYGQSATPASNFFALTLLPDGSPVLGGYATDANGDLAFLIARLTAGGQVDLSFGANGATVSQIGQKTAPGNRSQALTIRRHGAGFLLGGTAFDSASNYQFAMERFTASGGVDLSFGTSGKVLKQYSPAGVSSAYGSVVQPNGKIVLTGTAQDLSTNYVVLVTRYMPDGTPDGSFGSGGVVQRQFDMQSVAAGAVWQPDGKIAMAGAASDTGANFQFLTTRLVGDLAPAANFSASPTTPQAGQAVAFDASPSSDADGTIARASWDFGDAARADGTNASHTFAQAGTYTVTLTVTDDNDLTATTSRTITVTTAAAATATATAGATNTVTTAAAATPVLSQLTLSPVAFSAAPAGASIARATGSTVSYLTTAAGTTTFAVQRAAAGVRRGGSCVKPSKARPGTRKPKRCTRYVGVPGSFSHRDTAGTNRFRFTGRLNAKKLAPGTYRLAAQPTNPAGTGTTRTVAFRIIQ